MPVQGRECDVLNKRLGRIGAGSILGHCCCWEVLSVVEVLLKRTMRNGTDHVEDQRFTVAAAWLEEVAFDHSRAYLS